VRIPRVAGAVDRIRAAYGLFERTPLRRFPFGLVAMLALAIYAGLVGLDFGYHWDEPTLIHAVRDAVRRGELLPRFYCYPSVVFDLMLGGAAKPIVAGSILPALRGSPENLAPIAAYLDSSGFLLRSRAICFLVSMLAVVWVYWLSASLSKSRAEATLAAALLGFSWEFGYHARWIAPDAVMTQFAVLSVLCMHQSLARRSPRWLAAAAVAAGLACGTKYPAGALLLPLACTSWFLARDLRAMRRAPLYLAAALAIFAIAYLVSTPGTLLEYRSFLADVRREYEHYHARGHGGGHTIAAGRAHLAACLEYLVYAGLSRYTAIAVAFASLASLGAVELSWTARWRALVYLAYPAFHVVFMSQQKVMIVRNLIVALPFLALLAARGGAVCVRAASRIRGGKAIAIAAFSLALLANAAWLVRASRSIARRADPVAELRDYLRRHPARRFTASPKVSEALRAGPGGLPENIVGQAAQGNEVALSYASEIRGNRRLSAAHHNFTLEWFGTHEVNYNYYPTWEGQDRIVAIDFNHARALGLE
jgi:hypothetical protein